MVPDPLYFPRQYHLCKLENEINEAEYNCRQIGEHKSCMSILSAILWVRRALTQDTTIWGAYEIPSEEGEDEYYQSHRECQISTHYGREFRKEWVADECKTFASISDAVRQMVYQSYLSVRPMFKRSKFDGFTHTVILYVLNTAFNARRIICFEFFFVSSIRVKINHHAASKWLWL